jgi:hypothetical protein
MSDQPTKKVPHHKVIQIAVASQTNQKTVRKMLEGKPVRRGYSYDRIKQELARQGYRTPDDGDDGGDE